jgi:hypothetical protein
MCKKSDDQPPKDAKKTLFERIEELGTETIQERGERERWQSEMSQGGDILINI